MGGGGYPSLVQGGRGGWVYPSLVQEGGGGGMMGVPQPYTGRKGGGWGYKEGGGEMMGVPQPCTGRGGGMMEVLINIVCSIHVHVNFM